MKQTLRLAVDSPSGILIRTSRLWLALVLMGVFVACGGDASSEGDGAESVTRGLLSAAGDGGQQARSRGPVRQVPMDELGFDRGTAGAPIRIMEMSDYGCGYCRRFHTETFPALEEEFIDSGVVEWKFLPYVTGMFDNSRTALRAAECTLEQSTEAFERLDERLWSEQAEWKASGQAAELLRGWALEAGADASTYDACHDEGRRLDRIAAAGEVARELGVRGTPTFFVVGYGPLQGALPLETFQQILRSIQADLQAREEGANR
jgi:protein-disulfide isomerase